MRGDGTPAGWYDDGSARMRYWNGTAWTDDVAPVTTAPAPQPRGSSGVPGPIGLCAMGAAVFGLIGVCLPWMGPELVGIVLLLVAFVLSGVSLHQDATKWPGYVGLGVALLGTLAGVVMFIIGFMNGYSSTV
ncbi:DUF2510 domain-containing protein [Mumia sp. DW29H23]|uniref:DUF2510 domain-containing protein n=1 Tax=Mumia sp. DW29H23 TaxID=3421241 RepID=UPI003D688A7C